MPVIVSDALKHVNSAAHIFFLSETLKNQCMLTIEEIYRERLKMLIAEVGGQSKLATRIGKSPAQISQWLNATKDSKTGKPRAMDRTTARLIEQKFPKPPGWMDQGINAHFLPTENVGRRTAPALSQPTDGTLSQQSQGDQSMQSCPTIGATIVRLGKLFGALNDMGRMSIQPLIERVLAEPNDLALAEEAGAMADAIAGSQRLQVDSPLLRRLPARAHTDPVESEVVPLGNP